MRYIHYGELTMVPLLACLSALGMLLTPSAALPPDWSAWRPLAGEWVADVDPKDGATGAFSLVPELQGHVLVRRNFAQYPKGHPRAGRHEDLMVVYHAGPATRADYYDSEGHVIHYGVTVEGRRFLFVSDLAAGQPRFRLTYVLTSPSTVALTFEVAAPGKPDAFAPYITATAHRRPDPATR
jgi:hypothetical protein